MRAPAYGSTRYRQARDEPFHLLVWLRKLARVFWVCRASFISAAVGVVFVFLTQVHDLFLDVSGVGEPALFAHPIDELLPLVRNALVLGLLITVFWALPVHAVARLSVSDPAWLGSPYQPPSLRDVDGAAGRFNGLAKWVPRALGAVCYLATIAAAAYAWWDLPIETGTALAQRALNEIIADVAGVLVFAAIYWIYVVYRRPIYQALAGRDGGAPEPRIGVEQDGGAIGWRFDFIVCGAILFALGVILAWPWLLEFFPRLWLVPLLLGVWTPLIGGIAVLSYRTGAPLLIVVFAVVLVLLYINGDNHDSDLIMHAPAPRMNFPEAIKQWRKNNDCETGVCPSPILVLISGGASRSAFFGGSVLGLLTDATCEKPDQSPGSCAAEPLFARQLFAISSVSGGSVGAAVFVRALVDGRDKGGGYAPPCRSDQQSTLYFKDRPQPNWRDCLQTILAEDFLSPVIAGLGFRDVFSFVGETAMRDVLPDRGRRIENAIACAYFRYVSEKQEKCREKPEERLDAPLSQTSLAPDWTPILLLNSTSSENGKRFVFSTLAPSAPEGGRWLQDAYDFYETVADRDISLVAAAHNSARFPIISPAGALRAASDKKKILTKLVDGGYFENYGASVALDLALALKGEHLDPFVLLIANDAKLDDSAGWVTGGHDGRPNPVKVQRSWIPPLIAAPVGAVIAASGARGEEALTEMQRVLSRSAVANDPATPPCGASNGDKAPCFAFVSVRKPDKDAQSRRSVADRVEGISMSWWLSKPVQKYLDNQLELPRATDFGEDAQRMLVKDGQSANVAALDRVCGALAKPEVRAKCRDALASLAH